MRFGGDRRRSCRVPAFGTAERILGAVEVIRRTAQAFGGMDLDVAAIRGEAWRAAHSGAGKSPTCVTSSRELRRDGMDVTVGSRDRPDASRLAVCAPTTASHRAIPMRSRIIRNIEAAILARLSAARCIEEVKFDSLARDERRLRSYPIIIHRRASVRGPPD